MILIVEDNDEIVGLTPFDRVEGGMALMMSSRGIIIIFSRQHNENCFALYNYHCCVTTTDSSLDTEYNTYLLLLACMWLK